MRLLLAEDEKELSDALTAILKHNNYSVDAVYNGQDALDYLEAQEYDGVILDVMMPLLDGLSVLKELRKKGNSVPVLMLTARTGVDERVDGLDAGADDYLGKPFAMKELLARIRAMTRRQAENTVGAGNLLRFGSICLNRSTFSLSCKDKELRLANKEYQMLELLMSNPEQIISTERFMEKIWGLNSETEINVVWVYISYLRKKLAGLQADVEIRAARNQGYYLEVRK